MYKIGDIFYIDEKYNEVLLYCNNNNLSVTEIEPEFKDVEEQVLQEDGTYKTIIVNKEFKRFQIQKEPELSEKELLTNEYYNLINWFNNTYNYKEQKYRRLIYINKTDDDGVDASEKLALLYTEAEEKRERIQQLETLLN